MKIVLISDPHGLHGKLKNADLPQADVIICAGDISAGRGYAKHHLQNFVTWFSSLSQYKYKVMIAGNHDFIFEKDTELALSLIPENVIYLNDSGVTIDDIKIWGSPIQPAFYNWAFNRPRGEEIKKHWDLIPDDTNVLITHGPPYGFGDFVYRGGNSPWNDEDNVGCKDLLEKVKNMQNLKLHVFGHIHSGSGIYESNEVKFVNASLLDEDYEYVYKPKVVEL